MPKQYNWSYPCISKGSAERKAKKINDESNSSFIYMKVFRSPLSWSPLDLVFRWEARATFKEKTI